MPPQQYQSSQSAYDYQSESFRPKSNLRLRILLALLFLLILGFAGGTLYFYGKYSYERASAIEAVRNGGNGVDEEVIAEVAKHMMLPEGEKPTVAEVSDLEKLKEQPFFSRAEEGDRVLIYPSGRLILYRPSEDKIIEAGMLDGAALGTISE